MRLDELAWAHKWRTMASRFDGADVGSAAHHVAAPARHVAQKDKFAAVLGKWIRIGMCTVWKLWFSFLTNSDGEMDANE